MGRAYLDGPGPGGQLSSSARFRSLAGAGMTVYITAMATSLLWLHHRYGYITAMAT